MSDLPAVPDDEVPAIRKLVGAPTPQDVIAALMEGKKPTTIRSYRKDLRVFTRWLNGAHHLELADPSAAVGLLLSGSGTDARRLAGQYKAWLMDQYAAATVNRRLAALRSVVKAAHDTGVVTWLLNLRSVPSNPYRETTGPGRAGVDALFYEAQRDPSGRGPRNCAMLGLLYHLALRREEVVALDLDHVDLTGGRLSILGKSRHEREWVTLPSEVGDSITEWLMIRGVREGPLFLRLDPGAQAAGLERLTGSGLYKIVRRLGQDAGLKVWPHGLRHAAITEALELSDGNVADTMKFSRHRDPKTVMIYDDARRDVAGDLAAKLARQTHRRLEDGQEPPGGQ